MSPLISDGSVNGTARDPKLINPWGIVFATERARLGREQRDADSHSL